MSSGAEFDQSDRWLKIGKFGGTQFMLESFQGVESLSEPFEYALELFSDDLEVDAKNVVGKAAAFQLKLPDDSSKQFHGIVRSFEHGEYVDIDPPVRLYRVRVVPWLWALGLRRDSRVFQEKTVPQVVEQVFKGGGFTDYKLSLKGTYGKLDYCVQYRETDLDFVTRLLRETGIFYYFLHEEAKHTLVLADAASGYTDCVEPNSEFTADSSGAEWDTITSWHRDHTLVSSDVTLWSYDFENPVDTLEAKEKSKLKLGVLKGGELYDYTGEYTKAADGKVTAVARMEHAEAGALVAYGTSLRPTFQTGGKFKLATHPVKAEAGTKHALVWIEHRAAEPNAMFALPSRNEDEPRTLYENRFKCVPADVPYRSEYPVNRPVVHGLETGKVTGPKNSEIYADKYGRVRVQLHWDREGKFDDKSSCWIRVAQPWASQKFGFQFLPRVGDEVLVSFVAGDPDRPIVTGSVYNADNMPPYDPVNEASHSGLKTKSTDKGKAKNFNELRFEDKIGKELVYFHAERDFERVVENDDKLKIGFDAKDKGDQTIDIYNDRTVTLDKGKDTLTIKTGDRVVTIDKGNDSLTVKQGNLKIAVKAGAIDIEAAKSITLKVGGSILKMDPTSITLDTTKIVAKAKLKAEVQGTLVDVNASGVLTLKGGLVKIN